MSAEEWARTFNHNLLTVQRWCREGVLVARKVGRRWQIDVVASDRALSIKFGNKAEKERVLRGLS